MTSQEIADAYMDCQREQEPLWEIALQLALMNERNASGDEQAVQQMLKKVGLAAPVNAGSKTEVREGDEDSFRPPIEATHARHRFLPLTEDPFCGECGAGYLHKVHIRLSGFAEALRRGDFVADVLRSCAEEIQKNHIETSAGVAAYLMRRASELS